MPLKAACGALADWIKIKDGKIENYQVITPTAWNIGPMATENRSTGRWNKPSSAHPSPTPTTRLNSVTLPAA